MVEEMANAEKGELDFIYHEYFSLSSENQVSNRKQNKWLEMKKQAKTGYVVAKTGERAFESI
jgi:hypothetical protein